MGKKRKPDREVSSLGGIFGNCEKKQKKRGALGARAVEVSVLSTGHPKDISPKAERGGEEKMRWVGTSGESACAYNQKKERGKKILEKSRNCGVLTHLRRNDHQEQHNCKGSIR